MTVDFGYDRVKADVTKFIALAALVAVFLLAAKGCAPKPTIEEQEQACIEGCFSTCNIPGQANECYACVDRCVEALEPFRAN